MICCSLDERFISAPHSHVYPYPLSPSLPLVCVCVCVCVCLFVCLIYTDVAIYVYLCVFMHSKKLFWRMSDVTPQRHLVCMYVCSRMDKN
jgi:hypothetical protein